MAQLTDALRNALLVGLVPTGPRRLWLVDDAGDRLSGPGRFDGTTDQLVFACTRSGAPEYVVDDDDEVVFEFGMIPVRYFVSLGVEFKLNLTVAQETS